MDINLTGVTEKYCHCPIGLPPFTRRQASSLLLPSLNDAFPRDNWVMVYRPQCVYYKTSSSLENNRKKVFEHDYLIPHI
jgi:hypothetical protein